MATCPHHAQQGSRRTSDGRRHRRRETGHSPRRRRTACAAIPSEGHRRRRIAPMCLASAPSLRRGGSRWGRRPRRPSRIPPQQPSACARPYHTRHRARHRSSCPQQPAPQRRVAGDRCPTAASSSRPPRTRQRDLASAAADCSRPFSLPADGERVGTPAVQPTTPTPGQIARATAQRMLDWPAGHPFCLCLDTDRGSRSAGGSRRWSGRKDPTSMRWTATVGGRRGGAAYARGCGSVYAGGLMRARWATGTVRS